MKRYLPLIGTLLGLMLLTGLGVAALSTRQDQGPVFTVAELRERLAAQPASWLGRTVVVHAIVEPCPWGEAPGRRLHCADHALVLAGLPSEAPTEPLPLVRMAPRPLAVFLRGLPLLGAMLPRSPVVLPFAVARFHVRPQTLPAHSCAGNLPCYQALLDGW
jgi:hypothetical protein